MVPWFRSTESAHVDEMPGDAGRSRHRGADQMGAAARALPPLEVAIGGRRATLAGFEPIVVHRETHRASGLAPFETRGREHAIEAFALSLRLDQARARH